jgi:hypothetical protein
MSMRSCIRVGSVCSLLDSLTLGSSISLRGHLRVGMGNKGYGLSVFNNVHVGSSVSIRQFTKLGTTASVLNFAHCGSSVSMRGFSRLGSNMSSYDFLAMGSSVSVRSFVRLGSSLSVTANIRVPNDVELQLGNAGKSYLKFQSSDTRTYLRQNVGGSGAGYLYVDDAGGRLQGTWEVQGSWTESDARLKKDVSPMYETLSRINRELLKDSYSEQQKAAGTDSDASGSHADTHTATLEQRRDAAAILNRMRPVTYYMKDKSAVESKNLRFGFIAQELEKVLPSLVLRNDQSCEYIESPPKTFTKLVETMVPEQNPEDGSFTGRKVPKMVDQLVTEVVDPPIGPLAPNDPRRIDCEKKLSESRKSVNYVDIISILTMTVQFQMQDLDLVRADVAGLKTDMTAVKSDVAGVRADVEGLKDEVAGLKAGEKQGLQSASSSSETEEITPAHFDARIKALEAEILRLKALAGEKSAKTIFV